MVQRPLRILTAVAPYDGHDASVLALNRALLAGHLPVEVIYLGYNLRGDQICSAAIQEGVDGVAVASYNGGHLDFFPYLVSTLSQKGHSDILVFGGGGGTISSQDIIAIEKAGVAKIYGTGLSLGDIATDILTRLSKKKIPAMTAQGMTKLIADSKQLNHGALAGLLQFAESLQIGLSPAKAVLNAYHQFLNKEPAQPSRVIILTGDGGAGKSTIIDELVSRFLENFPDKTIAVVANDPTTSSNEVNSTFLADRVRMNSIYHPNVFMHSIATGSPYSLLNPALPDMVKLLQASCFDVVIIETPGTGQTGIDLHSFDQALTLYVKTKEYGGELQLEKDQLLRDADLTILNKVDLEGAESAFHEIQTILSQQKQTEPIAVMAKVHRDQGMDHLFAKLSAKLGMTTKSDAPHRDIFNYAKKAVLVPYPRRGYLSDIVDRINSYDLWASEQIECVRHNPADLSKLDPRSRKLLEHWPKRWRKLSKQAAQKYGIAPLTTTPNGLELPKVALPDPNDKAESLRFLLQEGLPGEFPYATGIYPFRPETGGETTRQFAGLGGPDETNQRLHLLNRNVEKPRLSIAFDSITLYGDDSDDDPSTLGKIGEGGVSIDSYEDMKLLLKGFSIPMISTSLTINGPAPVILAMYFVAALEIEIERNEKEKGRSLSDKEKDSIQNQTFSQLRGTVQADILKEIQAQNECIFQTDFAIKLLGDIQAYFIENKINRFYSLSISGYHIGEAGASPIQELAFTLANGFTYVEYFLSRGLKIDDFAPNLSFFFRVSHEAEWLAFGTVCRKIWAVAMRDRYHATPGSQRFKFHTQTSGRALQAAEWDTLNPLRQTYHALLGLLANTNSLHVDSADEPMTTPGEKYVRQAAMIPNYLQEEAEGFMIQNLLSGSYAFKTMVKQVQDGILEEFTRLDQLGGVGPATERGYQRRCIAKNSARYEHERRPLSGDGGQKPKRKIIGYNIYNLPDDSPNLYPEIPELIRPNAANRQKQLRRLTDFRKRHQEDAPHYLEHLKKTAIAEDNVFAELLTTVRHATLGQITKTLYEAGGRYRKMV